MDQIRTVSEAYQRCAGILAVVISGIRIALISRIPIQREASGGWPEHTEWDNRYRLITPDGRWIEFGLRLSITNPDRHLSSFGGSIWPGQIPEIFGHYGPDQGMVTYRSGPCIKVGVRLPE